MLWSECIKQSFHHARTKKLRVGLSLLGVIIGTVTTVTLLYALTLFKYATLGEYEMLGASMMHVYIPSSGQQDLCKKINESEQLLQTIDNVKFSSPILTQIDKINNKDSTIIIGIDSKLFQLLQMKTYQGRALSQLDNAAQNIWIGHRLNTQFVHRGLHFKLDEAVELSKMRTRVAGFLKTVPTPYFLAYDLNDSVIMPVSTVCKHYPDTSLDILLQVKDIKKINHTKRRITDIFKKFQHERVYVRTPETLLTSMNQMMSFVGWLGALTSVVCLLVGGIGIMNIQLANAFERKKEIAIRGCFGATRANILSMFLIETICLCLCGGLIGVFLGVFTTYILAIQAMWPWIWAPTPIIIGLALAFVTGLVFGIYPAFIACKQQPAKILKEYG